MSPTHAATDCPTCVATRRWYADHCARCGRPDTDHGDRPEDGPTYCGWTLAMLRAARTNAASDGTRGEETT